MIFIILLKNIADTLYRWHGKALFRVKPVTNAHTLTLKAAYLQMNSWACGASSGATLIRYFRPDLDSRDIYDRINPTLEHGTPEDSIVKVARHHGVKMKSMDPRSALDGIRYHLSKGRPVLAVWEAMALDCEHYIVIYGESRGILYVTNTGGNWIRRFKISYEKYVKNGGYAIYAASAA